MNGISHKQAIKWIHRRLDGLLPHNQALLLDEHLAICKTCHSYASEIDLLPVHLQSQFHVRWDSQPGPSQNVMEQITAKARGIPMTNRISSGVKLVAGAATLIMMAFLINFVISQLRDTSTAVDTDATSSPPLIENGPATRLLAFASDQNGNAEIYTVHPDGSGMTNLTNSPSHDSNPVWSPDGRRIAFESDRNGLTQIFLMNADGSDVIQLTRDEADHFLPMNIHGETNPWSPDGKRLLFLQPGTGAETSSLYALDITSGNIVLLANGHVQFNNLSWSPDGKYVGYVLNDSPAPDATFVPGIYVVDAAGSSLLAINTLIPQTDSVHSTSYYWTRDGSSIVFIAYRHLNEGSDQWIAYEAVIESQQVVERATSSTIMDDWWEETSLIHGTDPYALIWLHSDGTSNTLEPLDICNLTVEADYGFLMRRSPNGSQVINVYCPNREMWFYYANSDGTIIRPLMNSPITSFTPDNTATSITWSSDDQFIAVTQTSSEKSSLYILNVREPAAQPREILISEGEFYAIPSWQPTPSNELVEEKPTPQPEQTDDSVVAFTSDQNGNFDIYTMYTDGSKLTNITSNPAMDSSPFWSPDGKRVAFVSDRDGFTQIYLMDPDGSNVVQLTSNEASHAFVNYLTDFSPWSPDGSKLIFAETLPGEEKWKLQAIDANGENKIPLVDEPNIYNATSWSPDGEHVAFLADDPQNLGGDRIYVVNADGSNLREITRSFQPNEQLSTPDYYWSPDGQSIFFVAFFQKTDPYWTAYEARLDNDSLIEHATTNDMLYGWWKGISTVNNSSASAPFEWIRPDGTSNTLNPHENCQNIDLYQSDNTVARSPNGNWMITGQCANGDTWLYWANADGTQIRLLLDSPLSITDTFLSPLSWSPDDRFVAFTASSSVKSDLYIFNMAEALNNPTIQPVKLSKSFGLSWQPVPGNDVVEEQPTPVPDNNNQLIAFSADGAKHELDIYTVRADGSGETNLTNHSARDTSPVWSPDGKRIAFISDRDGNENIYAMNADGSDLIQLTDDLASEILPVWSPDGTKIAYYSGDLSKNDIVIYVMDSDGQNHRRLNSYAYIPHPTWSVAWTPDSQFIVFYYGSDVVGGIENSNTASEMGRFFVKVGVYAGGFGEPVGDFTTYEQHMLAPFALSNDGSKLFYLAECGQNSAQFCSTIKVIDQYNPKAETLATLQLQEFCPSNGYWNQVKWSPDRTRILFAFYCEKNGGSFYIANGDGSEFKPLTSYPILFKGSGFDWSPDSQSIVFSSALDDPQTDSLYKLNINDALKNRDIRPTRLAGSFSQISSPAWAPKP